MAAICSLRSEDMKNFTPALIHTGKEKFSLKRLLFGSAAASKNHYFRATSKDGRTYLLWLESDRMGNMMAFPCVLEEDGDPMVYLPGYGGKQKAKNNAVIQRWHLLINPGTFADEFNYAEVESAEFQKEYSRYRADAAFGPTPDADKTPDSELLIAPENENDTTGDAVSADDEEPPVSESENDDAQ